MVLSMRSNPNSLPATLLFDQSQFVSAHTSQEPVYGQKSPYSATFPGFYISNTASSVKTQTYLLCCIKTGSCILILRGNIYLHTIDKFNFGRKADRSLSHAFYHRVIHYTFLLDDLHTCPSQTMMAAVARLFIRGANSKLSVSGVGTGSRSSLGAALLKRFPNCSSRSKPQRRHAAHFTFQPDPVPTQYGECGWSGCRWLRLVTTTEK